MTQSPAASWTQLAFDTWALSMEASHVIWLRSMRIMAGGKLAQNEAERMVSEKMTAAITLMPAIMAGGVNQSAEEATGRALAHYAKPVRANRRRLSR